MIKRILLSIVLTIGVSLGLTAYIWSKQPAKTTVVSVQTTQTSVSAPQANQAWTTKYFESSLPPSWDLSNKAGVQNSSSVLDSWLLGSTVRDSGDSLAVTIGKLPAGGMSQVSDVVYRTKHPELFKPITIDGMPAATIAFSGASSYETDIFFPKGNKYAGISVSGQINRKAHLDDTYKTLLAGWHWL